MHGMVHGCMVVWVGGDGGVLDGVVWGWSNCMCVLPGLVRLDLGVGAGLDGDGEEVVGVGSCEMENILCFLFCRCEFFGHVQRFHCPPDATKMFAYFLFFDLCDKIVLAHWIVRVKFLALEKNLTLLFTFLHWLTDWTNELFKLNLHFLNFQVNY